MRIYGGVPIVKEVPTIDTDVYIARSEVDEVYELIVMDLEDAVASLPLQRASSNLGRATKGAAQALLAKVFLTIQRYEESMELCREVIASGEYRLVDDFGENFSKDDFTIILCSTYNGVFLGVDAKEPLPPPSNSLIFLSVTLNCPETEEGVNSSKIGPNELTLHSIIF